MGREGTGKRKWRRGKGRGERKSKEGVNEKGDIKKERGKRGERKGEMEQEELKEGAHGKVEERR